MIEDLKSKSTIELKAAVYDLSATLEQYTKLLNVINAEIKERAENEQKSKQEKATN